MLEQLEKDPIKVPSPSRNGMMSMLLQVWETLETIRDKRIRRVRSCVKWTALAHPSPQAQ